MHPRAAAAAVGAIFILILLALGTDSANLVPRAGQHPGGAGIAAAPSSDSSAGHQTQAPVSRVILIFYHKSGFFLSRMVARCLPYTECPGSKAGIKKKKSLFRKRRSPIPSLNCTGFARFAAPNVGENRHDDGRQQVVHFVRDPVDMAISSYLYHSQDPTPESWMKQLPHPCEASSRLPYDFASTLGIDESHVDAALSLCRRLANNGTSNNYAYHLRALAPHDALRLEAARSLVSTGKHASGDLLRMPANMRRMAGWTPAAVTMCMSSFNTGAERAFRRLNHALGLNDTGLEARVKDFVNSQALVSKNNPTHVTQNRVSAAVRAGFERVLLGDPEVGWLFHRLREAVGCSISG